MDYFTLFPIVKYEEDDDGISLLSLSKKKRLIFEKRDSIVLKELLENPLPSGWEKDKKTVSIMNEIIDWGMGYVFDRAVYRDEYRARRTISLPGFVEGIPIIRKMYIDLNGPRIKYEKNYMNVLVNNKCNTCLSGSFQENIFDCARVKESFDRGLQMSTKEYLFIGGDPFSREELLCLLKKIREKDEKVNITVNTNGISLLDKNVLNLIEKYEIKVGLTIFGERNGEELDAGYVMNISKIIECMQKRSINYCTTYVGNFGSNVLKEMKDKRIVIDNIADTYSKERGIGFVLSKVRSEQNIEEYVNNDAVESCLHNIISISSKGEFKACPYMDNFFEKNPFDMDYVFQNHLYEKEWLKTKSGYVACSKCRYNRCCKNCMMLDEAICKGKILLKDICDKKL